MSRPFAHVNVGGENAPLEANIIALGYPKPLIENQGIQGIDYEVVEGSPQESLGPDSSSATVTFACAYKDRYNLARQAVGFSWMTGSQLFRWLPMAHPWLRAFSDDTIMPNGPLLYATRVLSIEGVGRFTQESSLEATFPWPSYELAHVTVLFESVLYDVKARTEIGGKEQNRFVTKSDTSSSRFVTVERGVLIWDAPGKPYDTWEIGFGFPLVQGQSEIEWVWHDVPRDGVNWPLIKTYRGKVNSADWEGFKEQTLMLVDTNRRPKKGVWGPSWEITFQFLEVPEPGHNGLQTIDGTYQKVKFKGSDERPIQTANFDDLFNTVP